MHITLHYENIQGLATSGCLQTLLGDHGTEQILFLTLTKQLRLIKAYAYFTYIQKKS